MLACEHGNDVTESDEGDSILEPCCGDGNVDPCEECDEGDDADSQADTDTGVEADTDTGVETDTDTGFDHCEVMLKVRTPENFTSRPEVVTILDAAVTHGITTIEMTVKMDEDDGDSIGIDSGYAFYNSAIAPIASGYTNFDALAVAIEEGHERGLKIFAWIPQFHDKAAIEAHPEWQMMAYENGSVVPFIGFSNKEYFVNPVHEDARAYQVAIVAEVARNYDIDGLAIDWVRFDEWNMDVSDYTRDLYKGLYGVDPINLDFSDEDEPQMQQWHLFRVNVVAYHIAAARNAAKAAKPGLAFGVHILPPSFKECSQDATTFAKYLDYVAPMAYYDDWGFAPNWIWNDLIPNTMEKVGDIPIQPALDNDWSDSINQSVIAGLKAEAPSVKQISWFNYGRWTDALIEKFATLGYCD